MCGHLSHMGWENGRLLSILLDFSAVFVMAIGLIMAMIIKDKQGGPFYSMMFVVSGLYLIGLPYINFIVGLISCKYLWPNSKHIKTNEDNSLPPNG